jgi:hypothetical protein
MEQEHQLEDQPSGDGRALPTVTGEGGAEYPSLERRSLRLSVGGPLGF